VTPTVDTVPPAAPTPDLSISDSDPVANRAGMATAETRPARTPQAWLTGLRRNWRRPLRGVLLAGPALWLVFVVTHVLMSGRIWWWRPADLIPPLAFVLVPILLTVTALPGRRTRWPAAVLSAGALAIGTSLAGLNVPGLVRGAGPVPPDALRIVAWNTEYWYEPGQADRFYAFLRELDADVYLLQEYLRWPGEPERVHDLDRIAAQLPGYEVVEAGELITLSRVPIVGRHALDPPDLGEPDGTDFPEFWRYKALRTDLRVGGKILSVYNVHVPTPIWVGGPSPVESLFWDVIHDAYVERGPHLRALARDVAANENPVLVAGDMNTTSAMGDAKRFPAGLADAAYANRALMPASWPAAGSLPTLWRLDWTLVSPEVTVHRYEFLDPRGLSDHRVQFLAVTP
jgi:endonuclease/exonuclease/phosphatase (EEP) superfamily protein YafD